MAQDLINNSLHVNGTLSAKLFTPPDGSISNDAIAGAAGIEATKVVHQWTLPVRQSPGTAVVAATDLLHIARFAGEIVAIEAATATVATGADRTVTIDLQKSSSGGAFASVLTGGIVLDDGSTNRVPVAGTINSPDFVDGDLLQVVVAVAGSAGAQAQGLLVSVTLREHPQ